MIRKTALQVGVAALVTLIFANGYLVVRHVKHMRSIAALAQQSSALQAQISRVVRDLTDMETGQRGYLLTSNEWHLQPYSKAKDRLTADFAQLRADLGDRGEPEQSLESETESMLNAERSEMEHSILLRKQGYRHRAFKLVASSDGMASLDKAREQLSSLSELESLRLANLEKGRNDSLTHFLKKTVLANLALLTLIAGVFVLICYHERVLEQNVAQSALQLASHDSHLTKLMSALSNEARSKTSAIETNARLLLQEYGGFLPRHGHKCAEHIEEASIELERLRQDLIATSAPGEDERNVCEAVA
jgi:CHASE3 domain sensor protein